MTRFKRLCTFCHRLVARLALLPKPYCLRLVAIFRHDNMAFRRMARRSLWLIITRNANTAQSRVFRQYSSLFLFRWLLCRFCRRFECFRSRRSLAAWLPHRFTRTSLNPLPFGVNVGIKPLLRSRHYFLAFDMHLPLRAHATGVGQPLQGLNLGAAPIFLPYAIKTSYVETTISHYAIPRKFLLSSPLHVLIGPDRAIAASDAIVKQTASAKSGERSPRRLI